MIMTHRTSNPFSPTFSPSSPTDYRCNSAVMFATSSNNLYSSSFSPGPSFNEMSSPNQFNNWQNNNNDTEKQLSSIQFSPTIDRYDTEEAETESENLENETEPKKVTIVSPANYIPEYLASKPDD